MPEPTLTTGRTPRHNLPFLFSGQSQKEAFVNEAFARLDALVMPVVLSETAAPPSAPSPGDSFIIGAPATGDWSGREGAIATWAHTHWLYAAPFAGARVHDAGSGSLALYDGIEGWCRAAAPVIPTGGETRDLEARTAIAAIVAGLHRLGIFST